MMNYLERVKKSHITNSPKVLSVIEKMQLRIDIQAKLLSDFEEAFETVSDELEQYKIKETMDMAIIAKLREEAQS